MKSLIERFVKQAVDFTDTETSGNVHTIDTVHEQANYTGLKQIMEIYMKYFHFLLFFSSLSKTVIGQDVSVNFVGN